MIISASRRTDIPAFHLEWFLSCLSEGHVDVKNPYNPRQVRRVLLTPDDVDCIVFWSKDPSAVLTKIDALSDYRCGFQYTINAYAEDIEPNIPPLEMRIDTFRRLSYAFGNQNIVWRYDPMIISDNISADFHIAAFESIAGRLRSYTDRVVVSFVDHYRRIDRFWKEYGVHDPSEAEIEKICRAISGIAASNGMKIQSCAEKLPLEKYGISPGACLDSEWISAITGRKYPPAKAKSQRSLCRCVESADIGTYGTCLHGCRYCYAGR